MKIPVRVRCITYNHAKYIEDTMNGFCMQKTTFPFICTIIDDASTDGEQEIIKKFLLEHFDLDNQDIVRNEETDNYIMTYAQHKTNKNCYFAVFFLKYNHYSIKKNKMPYVKEWQNQVKYIASCEGDDYWTNPYKLQKQFDWMEQHSEYAICFHRVQDVTIDNQIIQGSGSPRYYGCLWDKSDITLKDYLKELCYYHNFTYQLSSFFMKREYMDFYMNSLKTIFQNFPYGDVPIALSALFHGKGYCLKETMSHYRALSGGFTSKLFANKDNQIALAKKELICYGELDDYLKGAFHNLIKYRHKRNQLAIESHLGDNYLTQFKPRYWILLKFQPLRATLSYLLKGVLMKMGLFHK